MKIRFAMVLVMALLPLAGAAQGPLVLAPESAKSTVLFIPAPAVAQAGPITVLAGLPVTVEWTHEWDAKATGVDMQFQAWTDTSISKNWPSSELVISPPVAPSTVFTYSAPHPGFTRGTHTFKVRAKNTDGLFSDSPSISIVAVSPTPPAPGTPRVIIKQVAGGISVEVIQEAAK